MTESGESYLDPYFCSPLAHRWHTTSGNLGEDDHCVYKVKRYSQQEYWQWRWNRKMEHSWLRQLIWRTGHGYSEHWLIWFMTASKSIFLFSSLSCRAQNPRTDHIRKPTDWSVSFPTAMYVFNYVSLKLILDIKSVKRDIVYIFCSAQESKSTNHDWMIQNGEVVHAYSAADLSVSLVLEGIYCFLFLLQLENRGMLFVWDRLCRNNHHL